MASSTVDGDRPDRLRDGDRPDRPDRPDRLRWFRARWALLTTGPGRDRGMSTAEYAVGTIAACAFAALLFKVVTSSEVRQLITGLIKRALNVAG